MTFLYRIVSVPILIREYYSVKLLFWMKLIFKSYSYVSHLYRNCYMYIAVLCEWKYNKVTMNKPRKIKRALRVTDMGSNRRAYKVLLRKPEGSRRSA
jgi:hypothetical protein